MKPSVGIFFVIDNGLIVDLVPLERGEAYGPAIQHGGHYEFWESFMPMDKHGRMFRQHAYDYFPRGRVVHFPEKNSFTVYVDRCINAAVHQKILETFCISTSVVALVPDHHYQCSKCNKYFIDDM